MTSYAQQTPDGLIELMPGRMVKTADQQFSFDVMTGMTDEERAGFGIVEIADDEAPEGQVRDVVTGIERHWSFKNAPAAPVPQVISDRQFFQQLAKVEIITQEEALQAVKVGEIPAALHAFLEELPEADRFDAEMLLSGAVEFRRDHPLTAAVGQAQGMRSDQIDDFFRAASLL